MINQETIQRIMDAARIEEVIGEFVSLKKRGTNHIGCCPFHNEKTPSFVVSPAKGIYKCFGCGKAGDSVRFMMEHEHYSYPEALRYLAGKYNIHIEEEKLTEEQIERNNERDALFHVTEYAQKHFAHLLYDDEMGRAIGLSYFHQRGLSDDIIKSFGLGYCMDSWSAFTDMALKEGYSNAVLEKTGLTIFKEDGKKYDRFRGRVMFPIYSISGRVLGFSARILKKDKDKAKYVNSPDSEIYNKGRILYGLFQARSAIARADKCYLVEGNVDVISMHQSGVCNTVASCGTALTSDQVRLLKRFTSNVTVLYDGDSAGIKAAMRAVKLLFEEGLHVRVVLFPDGEDPDSYAQKYGSQQLQDYLSTHEENFVLFKTKVLMDEVLNDPIRKTEAIHEIVDTIALVPDLMERQEYITLCASRFGVPETVLQNELVKSINNQYKENLRRQRDNGTATTPSVPATQEGPADEPPFLEPDADDFAQRRPDYPDEMQEQRIISLLVRNGADQIVEDVCNEEGQVSSELFFVVAVIVSSLMDDDLTFDNPLYQQIYDTFVEQLQQDNVIDGHFFMSSANQQLCDTVASMMVDDYHISKLWEEARHIRVPLPEHRVKRLVDESLLSFKQCKLQHKIDRNALLLKEATAAGNMEEMMILLNEKVNLDHLKSEIGKSLNRVIVP